MIRISFARTDGYYGLMFLAGRDHASIFKQRFNDVPGI